VTLVGRLTAREIERPWRSPAAALQEACQWALFNRRVAVSLARAALAGAALVGDKATARSAVALLGAL
jgi:hypothetical protein